MNPGRTEVEPLHLLLGVVSESRLWESFHSWGPHHLRNAATLVGRSLDEVEQRASCRPHLSVDTRPLRRGPPRNVSEWTRPRLARGISVGVGEEADSLPFGRQIVVAIGFVPRGLRHVALRAAHEAEAFVQAARGFHPLRRVDQHRATIGPREARRAPAFRRCPCRVRPHPPRGGGTAPRPAASTRATANLRRPRM